MSTAAAPAELPDMPPVHAVVGDHNTEAKCIIDLLLPSDGRWITLEALRTDLAGKDALDLEVGRSSVQLYDLVKSMGRTVLDFQETVTGRKAHGDEILIRRRAEPIGSLSPALSGLFLDSSVTSRVALRLVLGERRTTPSAGVDDAIQARLLVLESLLDAHDAGDGAPFPKSVVTRAFQEKLPVNRLLPPAHIRKLVAAGILENVDEQGKVVRFADSLNGATPVDVVGGIMDAVKGTYAQSQPHIDRGIRRGEQIINQPDVVRYLMVRSFASSGHTGKTRSRAS